jgi:hypothetical protein
MAGRPGGTGVLVTGVSNGIGGTAAVAFPGAQPPLRSVTERDLRRVTDNVDATSVAGRVPRVDDADLITAAMTRPR